MRSPKRILAATGLLAAVLAGCGDDVVDTPEEVVRASIERYGGDAFDPVSIRWTFRGVPFELTRDGGRFHYQRTVADSLGRPTVEVMENEGTWIEVGGQRREVDDGTRTRIERDVNSVVYLGFLPFRLDDPAVHLADLGETQIAGEPYRKVEVTFAQEGGGTDWEDRFVYWFHEGDWTLDYFAYWEAVDPPVTRFRRAVNRREVGGLVVQDYENYSSDPQVDDIAEYDRLFEEGNLDLVSTVEFDDVQVGAP